MAGALAGVTSRGRVSLQAAIEAQHALLPPGREREWIARHGAEFWRWVTARFTLITRGGDVSAAELLAHAPNRFRAW